MGKSALIAKPIIEARKRHKLAPSRVSSPLVLAGRFLIPFYLNIVLSFRKIEIRHPEIIIDALRNFQDKRTRLLVAFRHPYGDEPQLFFHVFDNLIPQLARRSGQPLSRNPHLRVIHDYAVPLWSAGFIRFLLPRAGALPVYHIKFDPVSLRNIRHILVDDPCPLGLAPEGQITYHSETISLIEQGTVRMGFWCARDLEKTGRSEKVEILPLSVFCQYDPREVKKIRKALASLEKYCGMTSIDTGSDYTAMALRIEAIELNVLAMAETYYQKSFNLSSSSIGKSGRTIQQRWQALIEIALGIAEQAFGFKSDGWDLINRLYRVRQEGWDRIYPETELDLLTPLERAFADRMAGEAWQAMRHMELVDLMGYHDVDYIQGQPSPALSFDRIVETVVNLQDLVGRLMGGNIATRPNVIRKKSIIVPAPCLDLSSHLPVYHHNARLAVSETTLALKNIYLKSIKEYLHEAEI